MWFVNIILWFLFFAVFIPFGIYLYHAGYKCAWDDGWEQGWDSCTKCKCKGCVCYAFTENALHDYYNEPYKKHDYHQFDYTELDKYMDVVDEQVDVVRKVVEDDGL